MRPGPFGDYIPMGGLLTILKVRDQLNSYDEHPGWYQHPGGTVTLKASDEELRRDAIEVSKLKVQPGNDCASAQKERSYSGH